MLNEECQAGTTADSTTQPNTCVQSADITQMPLLAAVLSPRKRPCLCCCCPQCGAVFMATALNEEYNTDAEHNQELLNDITDYARKGYVICAKDSNEFRLDYCEHLKAAKV